MRYVTARIEQEDRDEAYRIYVSDSLKAVTGASVRYYDIIHSELDETRTGEEIKAEVFGKLRNML